MFLLLPERKAYLILILMFPILIFSTKTVVHEKVNTKNSLSLLGVEAVAAEKSNDEAGYLMYKAKEYIPAAESFTLEVEKTAQKLNLRTEWLMALIDSESEFNMLGKNRKGSGAFGLLQWMPSTFEEMDIDKVSTSPLRQLKYVEQYLNLQQKRFGNFDNFTDLKLSVLYPRAVNKSNNFVLYQKPNRAYYQNKGLDWNKDGRVTVGDIEGKMKRRYPKVYQAEP